MGYGDRKIASLTGMSYGKVRYHREQHERAKEQGYRHLVLVPDIHWPCEDRAAEACVMEYISETQPDEVIQIGDAFDLASVARFRKQITPSQRTFLKKEITYGRTRLREWRSLAPDADYLMLEGNHEARLARYLEDNAIEVFDLADDELSTERLLGVEAAGWRYGGPYPEGVWRGDLYIFHGDRTTKYAAMNTLEHKMHSVVFGHTHRMSMASKSNGVGDTFLAAELGHLAGDVPGRPIGANWQHGFGVVWYDPEGRFHLDLVHITDGGCVVAGRKYGS